MIFPYYSGILDILTRKDNIYFMTRGRSIDARAEAVKYSTIDKRIENKRSEVFESNFVKGSAHRPGMRTRWPRRARYDIQRSAPLPLLRN